MIFAKLLKTPVICGLLVSTTVSLTLPSNADEMTEQEKRELFLKLRNQKSEPAPAQKVVPPVRKSIPKKTRQERTTPPQTQRPQQRSSSADQPRFGHGSSRPPQSTSRQQQRPQMQTRPAPTVQPQPAPYEFEEEEGPGFRGTVRNIFQNAKDRLQNLPRTSQSRGEARQPAVMTQPAPPTNNTVAKNGPNFRDIEKSSAPAPSIPSAPIRSTAPLKRAYPQSPPKLADHSIDLDDPMISDAVKKAEAAAKSLAKTNNVDLNKLKKTATAKLADTKSSSSKSKAEPLPVVESSPPQQIAMTMSGSAFERFTRQAMAMAVTSMVTTDSAAEQLLATPEPSEAVDPEDDKPDYVKAAERMGQNVPKTIKKAPPSTPPSLNDFVISSEHQTDLDLNSSSMTFAGNVIVESSRIHLTCDKFIVHMRKDRKGMSYGEALGNVVINMLDNGKASGNVGYSKTAIYRPDQNEIALSGWPRIMQTGKELVAVNADTKFILNTNGKIKTEGRARTILRN